MRLCTAFGWALAAGGLFGLDLAVQAQEAGETIGEPTAAPAAEPAPSAQRGLPQLQEIVVTATKHGEARVQDVPLAITAFGADQLEEQSFHTLQSLSYSIPNVQLEDVGTVAGYANFSIRGQGINSSIPSIDPTVGVFVDGVYMGISAGLVLDNFDLAGVEVLRGPQGVLFGRNVTGGAVLLRTKPPTDELDVTARASVETGLNKIVDASIAGPIVGGLLGGKIAVYHSDDPGWFTNLFDGSEFGAARQTVVRPAVRLTPLESLEGILRYEHGEADGDGPPTQNHALWKRGTFDFAVNNRGFYDSDWDQLIFDPSFHVEFGDGTITSVTGWRRYGLATAADIDGTTDDGFNAEARVEQEQISEELRYAGTFGPFKLTTGYYYFTQDLLYIERRLLADGVIDRTGGGDGDFSTSGVFAAVDWALFDTFTLNAGVRYTRENKDVKVSTISTTRTASGGSIEQGTIVPNFFDSKSWTDVSPRLGFQWTPLDETQIYGFWAKGFRSGGYNFRNTTDSVTPGPFDSEEQDSFELGFKHDFSWLPARLNLALFHNEIERVQRELNVPGSFGVSQTIVNSGDATIRGAEAEGRVYLLKDLSLSLQGGYLDGEYDRVTTDLNRDGMVNDGDKELEIPRLAPKTWGAAIDHSLELGSFGVWSSHVSYSHRDKNFFTDSNVGFLDVHDSVDARFAFSTSLGSFGGVSIALYGINLLDKASLGGDTPLPDTDPPLFLLFGGDGPGPRPQPSFSPLNKGRVLGAEVRFSY
ncbi:MAG: TonB-dependent receptor [Candidatus Binatia bacterium]